MGGKRLDIQGLRALAVGIVVAFHLWPNRFTGGFVGVDVFFVISGFLITAHLTREIERTGSVSLPRFWARRVRRLLPASFTVLLASLVAAFIVIPKSLLEQTLSEVAASGLYVQNWLLANSSIDYLAADNEPTLVQHYWSLSVEEQFYIVWPLLMIGAIAVASVFGKDHKAKGLAIGVALSLVFAVSLTYSIFETARSADSAYFITTTRAWEFAAGGLITFLPRLLKSHTIAPPVQIAMSWLGLVFIVVAMMGFDSDTQFPGWIALIPVGGAALILAAGASASKWSPTYIFEFAPIQLIGDLSYAIYLWHWPLIVLYPFVFEQELSFRGRLLILVVTFMLALATKFWIEDPIRNARGTLRRSRSAFAFAAASMALIVGISGVSLVNQRQAAEALAADIAASIEDGSGCFGASAMVADNACEAPFAVTDTIDPVSAHHDRYWEIGQSSHSDCSRKALKQDAPVMGCEFGEITSPTLTIALVGDSHADHLLDPLVLYGEERGWRIVTYTRGGCGGLEAKEPSGSVDDFAIACGDWADQVRREIINRTDLDVVLFSNQSAGKKANAELALREWKQIRDSGKKIIAVRDVPGMPKKVSAPTCVEANFESYDPCSSKPDRADDFMTKAVSDPVDPTPLIDLDQYFCAEGTCHAVIGGVLVYFDRSHLTVTFAKTLAPFLGRDIEIALDPTLASQQGGS